MRERIGVRRFGVRSIGRDERAREVTSESAHCRRTPRSSRLVGNAELELPVPELRLGSVGPLLHAILPKVPTVGATTGDLRKKETSRRQGRNEKGGKAGRSSPSFSTPFLGHDPCPAELVSFPCPVPPQDFSRRCLTDASPVGGFSRTPGLLRRAPAGACCGDGPWAGPCSHGLAVQTAGKDSCPPRRSGPS